MEAAIRNAEPPQSLPLFRAEALAARQKIQGEALFIRPFSFAFFLLLIAGLATVGLGYLLLAHFQPRVSVSASQTRPLAGARDHAPAQVEAMFNVPEALALNIRPGLLLPVRCQRCGSASFHRGTVTSVEPIHERPLNGTSASTFRVIVAVTPFNPLPGSTQLQQGAKLEAEFPLKRRPLIRWLSGPAVW
ncbi:MAG TPA: hypothetical protein VJV96_20815 [Candidatus Angelobacter sp.]|jgi:hypothetical protein|nr:hypothetical protein [Candidatus Angelobacter sp.]